MGKVSTWELPEDVLQIVEQIMKNERSSKSTVLRRLLVNGLRYEGYMEEQEVKCRP